MDFKIIEMSAEEAVQMTVSSESHEYMVNTDALVCLLAQQMSGQAPDERKQAAYWRALSALMYPLIDEAGSHLEIHAQPAASFVIHPDSLVVTIFGASPHMPTSGCSIAILKYSSDWTASIDLSQSERGPDEEYRIIGSYIPFERGYTVTFPVTRDDHPAIEILVKRPWLRFAATEEHSLRLESMNSDTFEGSIFEQDGTPYVFMPTNLFEERRNEGRPSVWSAWSRDGCYLIARMGERRVINPADLEGLGWQRSESRTVHVKEGTMWHIPQLRPGLLYHVQGDRNFVLVCKRPSAEASKQSNRTIVTVTDSKVEH